MKEIYICILEDLVPDLCRKMKRIVHLLKKEKEKERNIAVVSS